MERLEVIVLIKRFKAKVKSLFFHSKCHILIDGAHNSVSLGRLRLEAIAIH